MYDREPVFLRALEMGDVERTHKWHNDPELFSTLVGTFHPISLFAEAKWLEQKAAYNPAEVNLAICERQTVSHIGNVYLYNIDWVCRTARMGIFIGDPKHRGKGYGRSAIRQVVAYAFDHLNLRRIHFSMLDDNVAARKTYERCGFTVEGVLPQHVYKNGRYHDVVVMGLLRDCEHHRVSEPWDSSEERTSHSSGGWADRALLDGLGVGCAGQTDASDDGPSEMVDSGCRPIGPESRPGA